MFTQLHAQNSEFLAFCETGTVILWFKIWHLRFSTGNSWNLDFPNFWEFFFLAPWILVCRWGWGWGGWGSGSSDHVRGWPLPWWPGSGLRRGQRGEAGWPAALASIEKPARIVSETKYQPGNKTKSVLALLTRIVTCKFYLLDLLIAGQLNPIKADQQLVWLPVCWPAPSLLTCLLTNT